LANAGNCLEHQGFYAEAINFYDRALQERPDYPDVHARLGVIFSRLQRYQESIDSLNRAFRMKPSLKKESYYSDTFAFSLACLGKTEDALEAYRAAVGLNPQNARALAGVGWALLELGNYADAELPLRAAIKLEPGNGKPYLHLSFVLGGLGKYDESLVVAEQFSALEPENPLAHSNVGWLLSEIGRQREAALAYERAIETQPKFCTGVLRTRTDTRTPRRVSTGN
jgi:tetratricopeptide (TPR) repeat protein